VRIVAMLVLTALAACTETPSDLPPCVDPSAPCPPYDAGNDAASDASRGDATADAHDRGAPADAVPGP
jgi:hypothetical protein